MSFHDALAGELIKARTLRSVTLTALLAIVLGLAYCLIEAKPADQLGFTTPDTALVYALANLSLFATIIGVLIASSEHDGGQLTSSVLAVPRRGRILAAKLVVSAAITTLLGFILAVFIATIGQSRLGDESVYSTGRAGAFFGTLALGVASWTALGVISTCAAVIIRSQTIALTAMIVMTFGSGLFLMVSGPIFQYLPTTAVVLMYLDWEQQFSDMARPPDLSPTEATITVAAWCVIAIAIAAALLLRRDIGPRSAATE